MNPLRIEEILERSGYTVESVRHADEIYYISTTYPRKTFQARVPGSKKRSVLDEVEIAHRVLVVVKKEHTSNLLNELAKRLGFHQHTIINENLITMPYGQGNTAHLSAQMIDIRRHMIVLQMQNSKAITEETDDNHIIYAVKNILREVKAAAERGEDDLWNHIHQDGYVSG